MSQAAQAHLGIRLTPLGAERVASSLEREIMFNILNIFR